MATSLTLQSGVGSNSAGGALTLLPGISVGTDKAGANLTLNGGQGTGTGTGGSIIFKVADAGLGSSANTNTLQTALEIKDNGEIVSSGSHYIASAANASWGGLEVSPTLTFTGSTSVTNASPINMVNLSAPTLFAGSAMNVDTAASLYVAGAPSTGGSLTISNSYSLFVDAGATRLDGDVEVGGSGGNQTLDIKSHDLVGGGLKLAGTLVTASAAELNLVDGSSAGTIVNSKAVIYGASGEVNATTLQIGGTSITSTAAELNLVDGSSAGTIVNSKAVIYGASGEVNATTLQIGGSSITSTAAELNIVDGSTPAGTTAVAGGDGIVVNDEGTMRQTTVDTFDTYFSGTTKTLTNKTLTAPKIADGGFIADANGNEQIKFTTTASAVNEFTLKNNSTGNSPEIQSTGVDNDIDIKVRPKGTGNLSVESGGLVLAGSTTNSLSTAKLYMLGNFGTTAATNATEGFITEIAANTITDNQSGNSQTRTEFYAHKIGTPTIAAANTGVTVTDAATLFVASAPAQGTNMTLTKANALVVDSGGSEFRGQLVCTASNGISATAAGGLIAGTSSNTVGKLTLHCSGSAFHTTISAAAANTSQIDYVLPPAGPADAFDTYFLTSTTNGTMSWATNAGAIAPIPASTELSDATTNYGTNIIIDADRTLPTTTDAAAIHNVGFGWNIFGSATNTLTTGSKNTIMGYSVAPSISSGSSNTLIGSFSGGSLSSGIRNTFIGSASGGTGGDTGTNNTCLGYGATVSGSDVNNEITLGNNAVTDLRCADTSIASLSDARDKTDVIDLPWGLDFIDSLRPVQFTWDRRVITPDDKNWPMNGKKRAGFLAQELQASMTDNANDVLDLVYESNPERLEVKQGKLVPMLTQAIKELKAELDTLKADVAALKNAAN